MARSRAGVLKDAVASLEEQRERSAAKKASHVTRGEGEVSPSVDGDERLYHTTIHINDRQRKALWSEAAERQLQGRTNRHDKSAVAREVIEFWLAHRAEFNEWLLARRRAGR